MSSIPELKIDAGAHILPLPHSQELTGEELYVEWPLSVSETLQEAYPGMQRVLQTLHGNQGITPVVLICTGAYNPVHRMHVGLMKAVKTVLEKYEHMRVIAGFLSPSHDSYLRSKLQSRYDADSMNAAHRLQMLRLAIKDSGCNDWLYADEWESGQPGFIDYPDVVAHFETAIRDMGFETTLSGKNLLQSPSSSRVEAFLPIRVMYVCGGDHAINCDMSPLQEYGVVAVQRPGYDIPVPSEPYITWVTAEHLKEAEDIIDHADIHLDMSSTKLKSALEAGESVTDMAFPNVVDYIRRNSLYGTQEK